MPATPPYATHDHLTAATRDGVARGAAVVGLLGVGLVHLLDVPGKITETPYMGWVFIALIAGSIAAAYALMRGSSEVAWAAAATVAGSALAGYVVNRTVGLPQAMSDIGNWTEPLGLASLFIEGAVVALAATVLAERGAARRALVAASKDPSSTLDVVST